MAWKTEVKGVKLNPGFHFEEDEDFLYVVKDGETTATSPARFGINADPKLIADVLVLDCGIATRTKS